LFPQQFVSRGRVVPAAVRLARPELAGTAVAVELEEELEYLVLLQLQHVHVRVAAGDAEELHHGDALDVVPLDVALVAADG
jgi:hypothetical protein